MINQQKIEKRDHRTDGRVFVHGVFKTIQGEGPFCGTPCVFVRLTGCNLQCPACDTDYTSSRTLMDSATIVEAVQARQPDAGLVVITGGEPFRQDIRYVLHALVDAGYYVQIESNGTLEPAPVSYNLSPDQRRGIYLVCSPKTGGLNRKVFDAACALKYVVSHDSIREEDGLPLSALDHPSNPYPCRPPAGWDRPVYVQPMDAQDPHLNKLNFDAAVRSCIIHGHILQLQVHKIIGVE